MQRMGEGKNCIVSKGIVLGLALRAVSCASEYAFLFLSPKVGAILAIPLHAAPAACITHCRKALSSREVCIVCCSGRSLAGHHREKALEQAVLQQHITTPVVVTAD
eukprot:1536951-Prymnesium_polylepis.1